MDNGPADEPRQVGGPSKADVKAYTAELFARLGLGTNASALDLAAAHDERIEFLERAPEHQQSWAKSEMDDADEAYALLSGSQSDLEAATPVGFAAGTGSSPAATVKPAAAAAATIVKTRPAPSRDGVREGASTAGGGIVIQRRTLLWFVAAIVVVAVVFGVYKAGNPGVPAMGSPDASPSASTAQLDTAAVSQLMQKIAANPNDATSQKELGDLYFQASQFDKAVTFLSKAATLNPKDENTLLAYGAALYNTGDTAGAQKQWNLVVKINPNNQEAHYDLGFLALSKTPPDMTEVKAQWSKVVAIDPNSELAKTVGTHLTSLDSSASASPSAAPTKK